MEINAKVRKTMKKRWIYITITALVVIFLFLILWYSNIFSPIRIDTKNVKSITIVNNRIGVAKQITKKQDTKAICDLFNTTRMHTVRNWKDYRSILGGSSYTFLINYNNKLELQIICNPDSYLINNGKLYAIKKTDFEKFWQLNYEEKKYTFPGIQ
ncbi:hypothetical protein [Anaerocolumna xylanovorans]|uniref:Uncharacterized protein n=1 Tax=Anaerocolumna xylanovorans DSM 12503 TaxID=1121345 RepID=A0A1M7YDV9_9FIRM|nr:hypothetical protein [Anaerocolumna xylanovorans]SHO50771.1 hypothetical protein SAMN02745217_02886 [Anaerocolumna xylanovorans DSM 12503]